MELVIPDKKYFQSYVNAIHEYKEHNVGTYCFLDVTKYDIFEQIEDFRSGNNLPENYVRATSLYGEDKAGSWVTRTDM